ncbi:SUMO-specific isopeptidase USPL1 isoform 2-T4 [Anableps anableps]
MPNSTRFLLESWTQNKWQSVVTRIFSSSSYKHLTLLVQERATSLEYCPWCTLKGLTYALHSYHINFQESITLCTNPQCLFPLVTRPLEDVLASLDPVESMGENKKKRSLALEEVTKSPHKRQRPSKDGALQPQSVSCVPVGSSEHCTVTPVTNGRSGNPNTECEKENGYHKESPDADTAEWDDDDVQNSDDPALPACSGSVGGSSDILLTSNGAEPPSLSPHFVLSDVSKQNNFPALNRCRRPKSSQTVCSANIKTLPPLCNKQTTSTEKESLVADVPPYPDVTGLQSDCRKSWDNLVSVPGQFLWKNCENLCWLDSLLAVLVNCRSLRKLRPKDEPQRSSVWRLLREHEDICAAVLAHQQTGRDGVPRVPSHVLQNARVDLQSLRMSVFKLLQPKLHCKLGQRETPVFAMPLLLTLDSWVERLFRTIYLWEFKCSFCKVNTKQRVVKTLPTFTNIVPDWTPLNAAHFAPCNVCLKKNQMRTMLLQSVPPVFALHFVEGLPHNNVGNYAFGFEGKRYSVTAVIQYSQQLKHFVTWIYTEDGLWLEYDDLKHPACETYQHLQIPAQEMHVVFWEVEEDAQPSFCSPSNTFLEPPPAETEGLKGSSTEEPSAQTPDQPLLTSHNDTDIVCALSGDCSTDVVDTTVPADVDASIGASTLLDTFEGLTHNDIITLTLVELQPDLLQSEMPPFQESQQAEELSESVQTGKVASSPDSSVPAAGGDLCPNTDDAQSTLASSPRESESEDNSASDPTFVPGAKRRQGRRPKLGKTVGRQKGKKAVSSKDVPQSAPAEPSEPPRPVCSAQNNTAPVTEQTYTVSSTNNSPPAIAQKARWSYILSKHPLNQSRKSISHPPLTQNGAMISEWKPPHPVHSTPNPVRKPPIPSRVSEVPLITEEGKGKGLPPKPAEMYGGFGAKNSKLGSSKVPPVLSDTETLRYKLLKKLKAKKKKLAKLNQLLGNTGGAHLRPDSTNLNSPSIVSSSTYNGSACDDIFSELLSPATTASSLSPDSTDFLEMLAGGQDGANQLDCLVKGAGHAPQTIYQTDQHEDHNFLEEYLSQF